MNRAIDFVLGNLSESLRLEEVAEAADFSPFHFHRVFQQVVGMTLAEFVKRRRLEKALRLMAYGGESSLTKVALDSGFASSSDFSRCFKQQYKVPPSKFDLDSWRALNRSELAAMLPAMASQFHVKQPPELNNPDGFKATVFDLPARTVAYIRVKNPYQSDGVWNAAQRLMEWAHNRSRADGQWLGYQWENPEITPLEDCHYCIAVEASSFEAKGEVGRYEFPAMTVAQVEVKGSLDLELLALQWLYGQWLPSSCYVPDDLPCFEAWIGRPYAHGRSYFELFVQLPVKPI